jgi:DNA-3-methyladenine glycosylase I
MVEASVNNAKLFLDVQKEYGSFSKYLWRFVDFKVVDNQFKDLSQLPAKTPLSEEISKDLKKRGFQFLGPTIIYAHLQATGLVNDHLVSCFRHRECKDVDVKF